VAFVGCGGFEIIERELRMSKPNRLAESLSPYLLQHAHNPVDWHPWGDEALARARAEGALEASHAHLAVAITGGAGPGGGRPMKPVGTVHLATARSNAGIAHAGMSATTCAAVSAGTPPARRTCSSSLKADGACWLPSQSLVTSSTERPSAFGAAAIASALGSALPICAESDSFRLRTS